MPLKFLKIQWTIALRGWQAESVVYQSRFSGLVSGIHSPDLGDRNMGLVHNDQKIIRKIIQQRMGRLPFSHPRQMHGIVFYSGTKTRLPHHLNIKMRTLRDPLGLDKFVFAFKEF